ncbi:MAG: thioredoxin family protein [Chloroflexota bacterium]|nr:thioredoxin family protein [Chloroflexota bacterium]MDE3102445.1 thioredoxin family protein [Chloroflexota bacterium]
MSTVTEQRFRQGMTFPEWKDSMTRNRDMVEAQERRITLTPEQIAPFRKKPLHVLAIGADWCPDVYGNLPVLARIAAAVPELDLRVFDRDRNPDLMDQYLKEGKFRSIPVMAFFDRDWREVGVFIERPASVTALRAEKRREIFASHPEFGSPDAPVDQLPEDVRARLMDELGKMRESTMDFANAEVVRELTTIVEKA